MTTSTAEDLLQANQVVKERWKVVSIWSSVSVNNLLFSDVKVLFFYQIKIFLVIYLENLFIIINKLAYKIFPNPESSSKHLRAVYW